MADKLVTLQDENKTPIYPESRASVVKTENGTTVEEALKQKQPSGNYATTEALTQGLQGKADTSAIPTKLSQLANDSNYLTDAPSDGKQYGRKNNEWAVIEAGGTQYLDLSMFSTEGGTLSEEDYQKVVKAYEDGVSLFKQDQDGSTLSLQGFILDKGLEYSIYCNTIVNIDIYDYLYSFVYSVNKDTKKITQLTSSYQLSTKGDGTLCWTNNGQYAEFAKPTKMEDAGSGTVTKELQPNILYKFGECASLTITLAAGSAGLENEYKFEFVSGTTPTTLSLPDSVKWSGGEAPTMEANKTYQVSIVNNLAVYAAF